MSARAEAYDRHTGRYGPELSAAFLRFVDVRPGSSALDVGAGTGNLTGGLAAILGLTLEPKSLLPIFRVRRIPRRSCG